MVTWKRLPWWLPYLALTSLTLVQCALIGANL